MRKDIIDRLDMNGCVVVSASPNRPNIFYAVYKHTTVEEETRHIVRTNYVRANRVLNLLLVIKYVC